MSTLKHLVISAVLVLLSLTPVMAQVGTQGSILGAVTDASNAALPGATVSVRNLDTGLEQTAVTDEAGNFEILALPIGPYEVTVSMPGFKTWRQERLTLNVGERSRVAPVLEVGQITESVTVEGGAPLLQTERSSVQTVVEMQQIRELPLSTRNPVVLVNLVPGLRFTGAGGPERGSTVQGFGLRENQTEFQLDGLNANAAHGRRRHHDSERGHDRGVQRRDLQLQRRERTQSAADCHGHEGRDECIPRHGLGVRAERQVQRKERLFDGGAAQAESEPVRRRGRRSDHPEQDVLLRQLRGHADPAGVASTTPSSCSRRCSRVTSRVFPGRLRTRARGSRFPGTSSRPTASRARHASFFRTC